MTAAEKKVTNSVLILQPNELKKAERRFWLKVRKSDGCWTWTGGKARRGYGSFFVSRGDSGRMPAHRVAYELVKGNIPQGLTIDHLCRNPLCVNPNHLEAVTSRENILRGQGIAATEARKAFCPKGHPYSGANLIIGWNGYRKCRTCQNELSRQYYKERKLRGWIRP